MQPFVCFPMYPTLRAYVELLLDSPGYFVMFWNSIRVTAGILLGQILVGVPAAWAFARYDFPLKKPVFTVYITLMMMPFQVTMLSNYLVLDRLGLMDTLWAVILPGAFSTFPVFIMYRFFTGHTGGCGRIRQDRRGRRREDISVYGDSPGVRRYLFCSGAGISGMLESH